MKKNSKPTDAEKQQMVKAVEQIITLGEKAKIARLALTKIDEGKEYEDQILRFLSVCTVFIHDFIL